MIIESLFQSVFVALSAIALAVILRNAPIIRGWVFDMKKPWACNVCLPLYLCAIVVAGLCALLHSALPLLAYLPAYALSYGGLEYMARPPANKPFIPPEMAVFEEAPMFPSDEDTPHLRGRKS